MIRFLLVLVFAFNLHLHAQHRPHAFGLELGGSGLAYSLNYEHQSANGFVKRIGLSLYPADLFVPLQIGKVFGKRIHHFEVGAGLTYIYDGPGRVIVIPRTHGVVPTAFIGYRYQNPQRRVYWRMGFTPVVFLDYHDDHKKAIFFPWVGVGFGFRIESLRSGQ